jgi:localization factor PodJL
VLSELARLNDRVTVLGGEWKHQSTAFEALAERVSADVRAVAGAPAASFEALFRRIDRLDNGMREVAQRAETSPIERMLRTIEETLERRPYPAREASGETDSGLDAVKESLVEIKALHLRSDRKTHQALQGIHEALETVIARSAGHPDRRPDPHGGSDGLPADRLEAAVRRLQAVAISQVEAVTSADGPVSPASLVAPEEQRGPPRGDAGSDAGPRGRFGASFSPHPDESGGVRASFIAAARRATQAVVATDIAPAPPGREDDVRPDGDQAHQAERLIDRLKRTLDNHKRPLALAWGALLLGCGTMPLAPDSAHAQGMVEASSSRRPIIRPAGGGNCQLPFTPGAL